MDKLGNAETKLLHTLQWILLEAPKECLWEEMSPEEASGNKPVCQPQYPLDSLQLFVYMFAPLIYSVKESDLTFRLANGLRLWQPLWDHRQPDIPSFSALVKPKRNIVRARRHSSLRSSDGSQDSGREYNDLSVSGGAPQANVTDACNPSSTLESIPVDHEVKICSVCHTAIKENSCSCKSSEVKKNLDEQSATGLQSSAHSSLTRFNDVCQATFFDIAVLRCLFCPNWNDEGIQWALTYLLTRLQEITDEKIASERVRHRSCSLPVPQIMVSMVAPVPNVTKKLSLPAFIKSEIETRRDRDKSIPNRNKIQKTTPQTTPSRRGDVLGRPVYAVPRLVETLENGSLSEQHKVAIDDKDNTERGLPNSLFAMPETTFKYNPQRNERASNQQEPVVPKQRRTRRPPAISAPCIRYPPVLETEERNHKPVNENREESEGASVTHTPFSSRPPVVLSVPAVSVIQQPKLESVESGVEEIKNPFLKNLQLAKSASFGASKVKPLKFTIDVIQIRTLPSFDNTENRLSTGSSTSGETPIIRNGGVGTERDVKLLIPTVKSHSEPYHRLQRSKAILEEPDEIKDVEEEGTGDSSVATEVKDPSQGVSLAVPIPEIKPTLELPPNETEDIQVGNVSDSSKMEISTEVASSLLSLPPTIPRSSSDSFVDYYRPQETEEHCEAPGSTYYIQENGQMNYCVILRALHTVITKETNAKICDVSLHIIDTLLNFSVMENKSEKNNQKSSTIPKIRVDGGKTKVEEKTTAGIEEISSEDMNMHNLVMETLVCVFRALGCKHGCGEGLRGQAGNTLRQQGQNCLNRMYKIDARQFRRYLRFIISAHPLDSIIDFLHAFLGFCVDPKPKPLVFRPVTWSLILQHINHSGDGRRYLHLHRKMLSSTTSLQHNQQED
ncbi:protein unc-80 homolog isoform X2 [Anneissia japonica]|nr:protein unc-80 homolog isoform X2 [Anneissia japonica]